MRYRTYKKILDGKTGKTYAVGDTVTIKCVNGGGMGSCTITKITDTGFCYRQGNSKEKNVQYKNINEIC